MLQLIQHGRFLAAKMVGFSIMSRSSAKLYLRYLLGEEPSHLSILCLGVQVCDCLGKQLTIMDGRAWYDHSPTMILIGYQIFSSSTFLAVDICSLISFHLNIDSHFHFPVLKTLPLNFSSIMIKTGMNKEPEQSMKLIQLTLMCARKVISQL